MLRATATALVPAGAAVGYLIAHLCDGSTDCLVFAAAWWTAAVGLFAFLLARELGEEERRRERAVLLEWMRRAVETAADTERQCREEAERWLSRN